MIPRDAALAPRTAPRTAAASSTAPAPDATGAPTTAPTTGNDALAQVPLGHWGMGPGHKPWTPETLRIAMERSPALKHDVDKMLKHARQTVDKPLKALTALHSEGLLRNDPRKKKTGETLKRMEDVTSWAMAARMGPPDLAAKAQARVNTTLVDWAKHYKPTGNPINEQRLLPLFKAADMALPTMSKHDQHTVRDWIGRMQKASEHAHLPGMESINNWKTFSLQIRGTAATVLGDKHGVQRVRHELDTLLDKTIHKDGSSLDFHHRDAFHYHIYNSQALMNLKLFAPDAVSSKASHQIEKTFEFMKPYYLGEKTHKEFVHTQVQFDKTRANSGDPHYQPHVWDPREADAILQQARAVFPSLRGWTASSEKKNAGLLAELASSMAWPGRPLS